MSNFGVVGDTHEPACRVGYLGFCHDTFDKYNVDTIVHIGDLADFHAISFHDQEPQCPGPQDEFEMTRESIGRWAATFPNVRWCLGNHDIRPSRLAKTKKIPETMLKSHHALWGLPDTWKIDYQFIIDEILFKHGTGCGGVHPAWTLMPKAMRSVVIGHCHARAGVKWKGVDHKRYFAVDVGCGIDEKKYQFAYGKDMPERPFLSCAVILNGQPNVIAMPCGKGEPYHDSRFTEVSKPSTTLTLPDFDKFGGTECPSVNLEVTWDDHEHEYAAGKAGDGFTKKESDDIAAAPDGSIVTVDPNHWCITDSFTGAPATALEKKDRVGKVKRDRSPKIHWQRPNWQGRTACGLKLAPCDTVVIRGKATCANCNPKLRKKG